MADITLLELHPDGNIQVGPTSLRGSRSGSEDPTAEMETESVAVGTDGGRSLGRLLLVIGVLAALVLMATKLLGEDADEEIADFD